MHFNAAIIVSVILGSAHGHLIMTSPVPYGKDSLNNSPLVDAAVGSGSSDFPCKQRQGVYDVTELNHMAVGEDQKLAFEGSASHGGGSCQLSVSLDKEPTADSSFKVIKSFIGGCPTHASGNSGTDSYNFSIPQAVPNGQATLAWSWFNKVGNREMYMNCAPIMVTGGADNKDMFDKLPDMFVANLPTSSCSTVEGSSLEFPDPGQDTEKGTDTLSPAKGSGCSNGGGGSPPGGAPAYSAPPANGGSNTPPASSAASANDGMYTPPASGAASPTYAPAVSATLPAGGNGGGKNAPPTYPTANATSDSGAYAAPTGSGVSAPASTGSSGGGACSGDEMVCDESGAQFGLCVNGEVVYQPVAPGTRCAGGQIVDQRAIRRRNGGVHLRRHAQNVGKHVMI